MGAAENYMGNGGSGEQAAQSATYWDKQVAQGDAQRYAEGAQEIARRTQAIETAAHEEAASSRRHGG